MITVVSHLPLKRARRFQPRAIVIGFLQTCAVIGCAWLIAHLVCTL